MSLKNDARDALGAAAVEGLKEAIKALFTWAREKRAKRKADVAKWESIQERHVPPHEGSKDKRGK